MLPIYLCTSHTSQNKQYQTILNNILFMEDYHAYLVPPATSPEAFLQELHLYREYESCQEALYIIDLDMEPNVSPFLFASRIRAIDTRGYIVIITQDSHAMELAMHHHIEALDIIPKKEPWNLGLRINQCIQEAMRRSMSYHHSSLFSFTSKNHVIQIPLWEILYITSVGQKLSLVTLHKTYSFYGSLAQCMTQLDEHFLFCHRAFIVNVNQIASIDRKRLIVTFHNNAACIASVRGMRRLLKYIEKNQ